MVRFCLVDDEEEEGEEAEGGEEEEGEEAEGGEEEEGEEGREEERAITGAAPPFLCGHASLLCSTLITRLPPCLPPCLASLLPHSQAPWATWQITPGKLVCVTGFLQGGVAAADARLAVGSVLPVR